MMDVVQVILDDPQSGIWNMAVDEALLEESLRSDNTFLRFYRWSEATVSLGYFQRATDQQLDPRLANLPSVRRLSGGGAILHHHELTYSCCLPPSHPLAKDPSQLYEQIHAGFIQWISAHGIEISRRGHSTDKGTEPFLCFQRMAAPDLVVHDQKVLGSAQRRRRGAVLQHGSLLLRASEYCPEIHGLCDFVSGFSGYISELDELSGLLGKCLGRSFQVADLPRTVLYKATRSCDERVITRGPQA